MRIGPRITRRDTGAAIVDVALILPLLSMMASNADRRHGLDRKQDIDNARGGALWRDRRDRREHQCRPTSGMNLDLGSRATERFER